MKTTETIDAYVCEIRTNRAGDRSDKITVTASYESAGVCGDICFFAPITFAKRYYMGQKLIVSIKPSKTIKSKYEGK